jgi:cell division septation protein DedD
MDEMISFLKQFFWILSLVILITAGCTQKTEEQPPSNRTEAPSNERDDRADRPSDRSDSQQSPSGPPRAPKGEVKRNEYTVEVGLFNRPEEADQLAYELRAQRVNNFVQPVGKQWRVCVGRYFSEGRANRMANQLRGMGFANAKVIAPGN